MHGRIHQGAVDLRPGREGCVRLHQEIRQGLVQDATQFVELGNIVRLEQEGEEAIGLLLVRFLRIHPEAAGSVSATFFSLI